MPLGKGQLEQKFSITRGERPGYLNILFKTDCRPLARGGKLIGVDILTMPGVAGHA